ncbi:hypothetical protein PIB30_077111 [Stylosanthes scabra]|uniref:Uncharacterized protein n=1 Tax=Stylosanthes scabra TaxID=79078 RepID=A0ABU6UT24_9FABA|nr:hypothetical protein [Stylosanthes scabra]
MLVIEMYVEFEHLLDEVEEVDRHVKLEGYYSKSDKEFEDTYEFIDDNENDDQLDHNMEADVEDVANILTNQFPFEEPHFMTNFDFEALNALEFPEFVNPIVIANGEFAI